MPGPDDKLSAPYAYPAARAIWGIKVNGVLVRWCLNVNSFINTKKSNSTKQITCRLGMTRYERYVWNAVTCLQIGGKNLPYSELKKAIMKRSVQLQAVSVYHPLSLTDDIARCHLEKGDSAAFCAELLVRDTVTKHS